MDSKIRHAAFNRPDEYFKDVRLDRAKPKKFKIPIQRGQRKSYSRCPTCGGMVTKPCVLCNPDTIIYGWHRKTKQGRVFHSLSALANNLDKYTAGEDIDNRALQLLVE